MIPSLYKICSKKLWHNYRLRGKNSRFRKTMSVLLVATFLCFDSYGQLFTKKDIAPMALTFAAGYSTGWREEVIYHPNQLFRQYPNLNRKFWDIRVQDKPGFLNTEWDADHVLKGTTVLLFTAAVTFKLGEKKKWYLYILDGVKYFAAYHIGFYVSYNLQMNNKL